LYLNSNLFVLYHGVCSSFFFLTIFWFHSVTCLVGSLYFLQGLFSYDKYLCSLYGGMRALLTSEEDKLLCIVLWTYNQKKLGYKWGSVHAGLIFMDEPTLFTLFVISRNFECSSLHQKLSSTLFILLNTVLPIGNQAIVWDLLWQLLLE